MSDKSICCICKGITEEDSAVLAIGAYGTPRLLCKECEEELDISSRDKAPESIKRAMSALGEKMTKNDPDELTVATLTDLLTEAGERLSAIESGEYDFSNDEKAEDGFDEIPEELRETEEDKALDERDEKRAKLFDKIFNIAVAVMIAAAVCILIYRFLK